MNVGNGWMNLNENFRKFPIKFYRKQDGTIHYENKFLSGDAKTMEKAFKIFSGNDWERDLLFYYDDVTDVKFGSFTPAYTDKKYKGMKYLGQINLSIDVDSSWANSEHSITYLSKHPEAHKEQMEFIKKLKREAELDKFKDKIKNGLKRVVGFFKNEMFFPEKTRNDLICDHCGEIIPVGNYYEYYQGKNYHLECIWDKLCNKKQSKDYQDCREFFFSLQRIRKWPATGLDVQDDYKIDLEFVKNNDRRNKV